MSASRLIARGSPDALRRAPAERFDAIDLAWEQEQESAARMFLGGASETAARHWQRALAIAREHFDGFDPRLATSLTNCGRVCRRAGDRYQSDRYFREALLVWDGGWRWIALMSPPGQPDRCYDEAAQAQFNALLERGRALTAAIERDDRLPSWGLARWLVERPSRPCDLRKLLAAVLLIASRRD